MTYTVPFLFEDAIALSADELLQEFGSARESGADAPISIEEIAEKHLRLRLEFDDLHRMYDVPRTGDEPLVLGAIFLEERTIIIDQGLDPEERPEKEGRYRFTLAHEVGHHLLHREHVLRQRAEAQANGSGGEPAVICRADQAKEPIEWQANYFSSCLLMPRSLVHKEWLETFCTYQPLYCKYVAPRSAALPEYAGGNELSRYVRWLPRQDYNYVATSVARELAPLFSVSVQAMRIRLEQIGLLQRHLRDPYEARERDPVDWVRELDTFLSRRSFGVK